MTGAAPMTVTDNLNAFESLLTNIQCTSHVKNGRGMVWLESVTRRLHQQFFISRTASPRPTYGWSSNKANINVESIFLALH